MMKNTFVSLLLGLVFIAAVNAQPRRFSINDDTSLLTSLKSAGAAHQFDISVKDAQPFALNPMVQNHYNVAIGDTLQLALFTGKEYLSVIQSKTTDVNGVTVIVSKLTGFQFAWCFISISDQKVLMTIDIPELKEKYTTRLLPRNSAQYLVQLDETRLDILKDGLVPIQSYDSLTQSYLPNEKQRNVPNEQTTYQNNVELKSAQVSPSAEDSAQIDILMVYTPAAKDWADSFEGGINNIIGLAMAKCNLVSKNSKLGIKFNLVHSTEVDYNETENSTTDLNNITNGLISNVNAIRDVVAADLVVLVTNTNDFGGMSWLLGNKDGNEEYGYSVIRVQQASGLSTIHEIGHSLGANHPKEQNFQPGPTIWSNWPENTWSAGWRWKGDDNNYYCDLMTYELGFYFSDGITHTAVPYFSDPDISFQGQSMGQATEANNARTIRETKQVVEAYRKVQPKKLPTVYTVIIHDITKDGSISGGCVTNEGESKVIAKGIVWGTNRLPKLSDHFSVDGSGAGSFISQLKGMTVDSIYYVRAYATNGAGTSYGNQISFIYTGGVQRDFITRWKLPSGQDKIDLILVRSGEVAYKWETVPAGQSGSGIFPSGTGLVKIPNLPAGQTIRVSIAPGNLKCFYNKYLICPYPEVLGPDRVNLVDVEQWGTVQWKSMQFAFYGCTNLNITATDIPSLSNVTDMGYMFYDCNTLNSLANINKWDVSCVTKMWHMFENTYTLNPDIKDWDVHNVVNMESMFKKANSFNMNIGGWVVSKVKNMAFMFSDAHCFNQNIEGWDVSRVTDMKSMFWGARAFDQNIGGWNVSNVTSMLSMFKGALVFNKDIGKWNVSKVTDMESMFQNATAFNQNIGDWNVSKVNNLAYMFYDAQSFNQCIGRWNVSNVKNMSYMFNNATAFNQEIGDWNVSGVTNMHEMFIAASAFNQNIRKWDVSNVTDMTSMFSSARSFNQYIGSWNISKVKNISKMFWDAITFNQDISGWDISGITDMYGLFGSASAFNQNIGRWNVSKVKDMSMMFRIAISFNQDISKWDVSNVTNMNEMFNCAYTFNQDIGRWKISGAPNMENMLDNSGMDCFNYSSTLKGWASNANTPDNLKLGANDRLYPISAVNARSQLTTTKGWTILGDRQSTDLAPAGSISGSTSFCLGQNAVTYSVPTIANATSYIWILPSGATGTSTTNSITVDFGISATSGNITVKGHNSCNDGAVSTLAITVNPLPAGAGTISGTTTVCQGQNAVTYAVPLITNATSYIWTLPGGAIGTSTTNSITVNFGISVTSGNITVKGHNTCGDGAVSTLAITVNPFPASAGTITGTTTVCQGQNAVTYAVPAIANETAYVWTLPNGAIGTSTTNSITVDFGISANSGNITVKGHNSCGDGAISTLAITVNPLPASAGIITGTTTVCQGQNAVTYAVPLITNATSYVWTLPGGVTGTSTTNSITVNFGISSISGNITVKGHNSCGDGTVSTLPITVNPFPASAGTILGTATVCQGQNAVSYAVPVIANATSYIWTLPNGATGTSTTNSITVNFGISAISGNITVKGHNSCGDGSVLTLPITVNPISASAGTISGATTVCQGQNAVTYAVPTIANATSYVWTLPNGATGTSTTNSITINFGISATSGNITVKGHNSCGDGTVSTLPITVNPFPASAGTITGTTTVCQGQNTVNYAVPAITNATSYVWTLPNGATGTSTNNSITVDFGISAASGNITVKGHNSCGDGAISTLAITVSPLPATPTITRNGEFLHSSVSKGNQWYDENGEINGAINQDFKPANHGNYFVAVVSSSACNSFPSNTFIYIPTGFITNSKNHSIKVYPNPVTNELIIEIEDNNEKINFQIINTIGQEIYKGILVNKTTVHTGSFAPGAYLVKFENDKSLEFKKIIKR